MTDGQPADAASPSRDERLLAMLAHVLSFTGGGFIPPLVILLSKRDSRFVRFHAVQALLISVAALGAIFGGFFVMAFVILGQAATHPPGPVPHPQAAPPPAGVFLLFPFFFLGMGGWVIASIVLGVRANAGHWSALPGFGWLTRKLIGPDAG